ncbi:hypothetical protein PHISP_08777, partial [Aspergillus sp. HF37]
SRTASAAARTCACCGTCAGCPISGESRPWNTRLCWRGSSVSCRMDISRRIGLAGPSNASTGPLATSTPFRSGWHISAPGPMSRKERAG